MKAIGRIKTSVIKDTFNKYGIVAILIGMIFLITIVKPQFMSSDNLFAVLSQACVYGLMALAESFIIISAGIDLSAAAIVAFAGVVGAAVGQSANTADKVLPWLPEVNIAISIAVMLVVGLVCGLINGLLIAKAKTPPFIATLGMTTVVRGFALLFTGGEPVSNLIDGYRVIGGKLFGIIPIQVLIFVFAAMVCWVILKRTRFGMETYAIGINPKASSVSGVRLTSGLVKIYALAGILYGVAAVVLASRTQSVHPGAATGYELTAIAACIIGGISPIGGKGAIWGTIVGALIISVLRNALTLLSIDSYWQQIAEGAIIILAVYLDMRKGSRS
jgi:inositol transport system permease protein